MNKRVIILFLMSICLTKGLKYLGGNLNWQPSLEEGKQGWITIILNINWLADDNEKALCKLSKNERRINIAGYITLSNTNRLKDFTNVRCRIDVKDTDFNILSVNYRISHKAGQFDVRVSGKLDTTKSNSKSWRLQTKRPIGSATLASPPIAAVPSLVELCVKKPLTHNIQALNNDASLVQKCRWSAGEECGGACPSDKQMRVLKLDENCSLKYFARSFGQMMQVDAQPQVLAITVESFRASDKSTSVSSTNLQFSIKEVPLTCNSHNIEFSDNVKQGEFFQEKCSSPRLEIPFTVTSSDNGAGEGLKKITMANGPPGSELSRGVSSSNKAAYKFTWKPSAEDDGTHPICFAMTSFGQTQYECSTLTYGPKSLIPKSACDDRKNCEVNKFCPAKLDTVTKLSFTTTEFITEMTTTEPPSTSTRQPTVTTRQPTTTTQQLATTEHQPINSVNANNIKLSQPTTQIVTGGRDVSSMKMKPVFQQQPSTAARQPTGTTTQQLATTAQQPISSVNVNNKQLSQSTPQIVTAGRDVSSTKVIPPLDVRCPNDLEIYLPSNAKQITMTLPQPLVDESRLACMSCPQSAQTLHKGVATIKFTFVDKLLGVTTSCSYKMHVIEESTTVCHNETKKIFLRVNQTYSDEIGIGETGVFIVFDRGVHKVKLQNHCYITYIVDVMGNITRKVQLQAEYPIRCTALTRFSLRVVNSYLLQHSHNLQKVCPGCQVSRSAPAIKCGNDTLIATWNSSLSVDQQTWSRDLKTSLRKILLQFETNNLNLDVTIINPLPRVISPVRDGTGLNLRVFVNNACVDQGFIYNPQYDVCERI